MLISEGFVPAFKEWQVVCSALASGEQSLILRKGGIAEGRQGFQWQHPAFFLFPTRFHQQSEGVKGKRYPGEGGTATSVAISLFAEVVLQGRITDWERVEGLADYHIWTDEVVRERFQWGDEPGLSVAVVRVYRLPQPWVLENADRPEFGGCRSWLQLPSDEFTDKHPPLAIADCEPVVDAAAFAEQLKNLRELLGDLD